MPGYGSLLRRLTTAEQVSRLHRAIESGSLDYDDDLGAVGNPGAGSVGGEEFDVGQLADEADLIGGVRTCVCGDDAADGSECCGNTERDACPSGH